MNDDDLNKTSEPPRNEGDANFDATSIDETKIEEGTGFFHMTTKFKWILALSIPILLAAGVLIYSVYRNALVVEIWQLAIWCVCVILSFYSIAKKSLATMILNVILFFGVSLIPAWQSAHENFQSVFELFFG
ncbi:MAG: hypothetical protein IKZ53_04585 [Selenomonadaceae bacterium]|nr:hypothetical protein [Selenomonadaceae bacterium]